MYRHSVRRCKLDPSLKTHPVSNFDGEKDKSAFNLNPGFLSVRHYSSDARDELVSANDAVAVQIAEECVARGKAEVQVDLLLYVSLYVMCVYSAPVCVAVLRRRCSELNNTSGC